MQREAGRAEGARGDASVHQAAIARCVERLERESRTRGKVQSKYIVSARS